MPTEAEVEAACREILAGLDGDTLEYLTGGVGDVLEEDGSVDDLVEYVAPMLEELCGGDDAAARTKAEALWARLKGGAGPAAIEPTAECTTKPKVPISLGAGTSRLETQALKEAEAMRSKFAAIEIKFDHAVEGSTAANPKDAARMAAKQAWLAEEARIGPAFSITTFFFLALRVHHTSPTSNPTQPNPTQPNGSARSSSFAFPTSRPLSRRRNLPPSWRRRGRPQRGCVSPARRQDRASPPWSSGRSPCPTQAEARTFWRTPR